MKMPSMQYPATPNHTVNENGKCKCVSFPYHQLHLIKKLDTLAHMELCSSSSAYLRKLIIREWEKVEDQRKGLIPQFS